MKRFHSYFTIFACIVMLCSVVCFVGCSCDKAKKKTPKSSSMETTISDGSPKTDVTLKVYYKDSTRRFYTQTVKKGSVVTLKKLYRNQFRILRYVVGEFTNGTEYPITDNKIVMNDDLVLSMVWGYDEKVSLPSPTGNQVVIRYYPNFGDVDISTYVCDFLDRGTSITSLPKSHAYTSDGRLFKAWYTDRAGVNRYTASQEEPKVINSNLDLYAQWG